MTTALTPSDIRTMARKAADYITFHCDGLSRGFEITHKGYIAFINYEAKMCNDESKTSCWCRRFGTPKAKSIPIYPKPCN